MVAFKSISLFPLAVGGVHAMIVSKQNNRKHINLTVRFVQVVVAKPRLNVTLFVVGRVASTGSVWTSRDLEAIRSWLPRG